MNVNILVSSLLRVALSLFLNHLNGDMFFFQQFKILPMCHRNNKNFFPPPLITYCIFVPTDPQNLPESNPMRMEETRKRNALVMQTLKEAAETNENLARGLGRSAK